LANKGSGLLKRLVVATLALLAVGFFVIGCSSKSETAKAEAGTCIEIKKASATDADTEPLDCADNKATYKIFSTNETETACPSDAYTTYTETRGSDTTAYLCLYENLKEGSCYSQDTLTNILGYAECSDPSAKFKVTTKEEGTEDESICAADDVQYLKFPDPKLTYCLGDAAA
jgi:hypothetical protein